MKIPHGTFIAALDGRKMLLFRNDGDVPNPDLKTVLHDQAENPRSSAQGSDRPGRSFASAGPRRAAMSETDLHAEAKTEFVARAVEQLEDTVLDTDAKLILLAAPSALGEIRKQFSDQLKDRIIAEIGKDMVNHVTDKIVRVIDDFER